MYRKGCEPRQRSRFLFVVLSTVIFKFAANSSPVRASFFQSRRPFSAVNRCSKAAFITKALSSTNSLINSDLDRMTVNTDADYEDRASTVIGNEVNPSENSILSTTIDKALFDQNIRLVAINIPAKLCTEYMKEFKDHLLKRPRMKRIFDAEKDGVKQEERRLILLSETNGDDLLLTNIPENLKSYNLKNGGIPEIYMLKISYENIPVDEVLRKILPEDVTEIPSSFEQVGHIAHLNLREEVLKYKYLIGKVILDKNSNIRTVVNKVGSIETEFRTFPMEVIAGKECSSSFNYSCSFFWIFQFCTLIFDLFAACLQFIPFKAYLFKLYQYCTTNTTSKLISVIYHNINLKSYEYIYLN